MRLYERHVRVTLGQVYSNLKIVFEIEATLTGAQTRHNGGWVEIFNLSESSRNKVGKEWDHITVEAGYLGSPGGSSGNVGIIGSGNITDVEHIREKTDIRTHIKFADAYTATSTGVMSKTIEEETEVKSILEEIVNGGLPGISMGDIIGVDGTIRRPLVLYGSSANELNKLGLSHNFFWSSQNEVFQAIAQDQYLPQTVAVGPYTGMIGTPTMTDNGIKVDVMMNPQIRPMMLIQVTSETLSMSGAGQLFRVDRAIYFGDNGQGETPGPFGIHIEGTAIGG